jgi:hypothetical protein
VSPQSGNTLRPTREQVAARRRDSNSQTPVSKTANKAPSTPAFFTGHEAVELFSGIDGDRQLWWHKLRPDSEVYLIGREPIIRISTSLLALCCQSGLDATLETPIRARSRSNGSRSLRMLPLLMARFTRASMAPWT